MAKARLALCNTCPFNVEGTCALCGCNIAEKVEKIEESCPNTPKMWHTGTGSIITSNNTAERINSTVCIPCGKR